MDLLPPIRSLSDHHTLKNLLSSPLAKGSAIICAILGALIAFSSIIRHLTHYNKPKLQKSIIRLLLFVPIYSVFATLAILFPQHTIYFEIFGSIWEAIVVYSFLCLILEYCGGESSCAVQIAENPGLLRHPWPISWVLRYTGSRSSGGMRILNEFIPMDDYFLKICKRLIILFVLINPIISICWMVVYGVGISSNLAANVFHQILYNLAVCCALYALMLVYLATRRLPILKSKNPIWKFVSIKIIIVFTWYQSLFLFCILGFQNPEVIHLNYWLLCIELPMYAITQSYAFPASEFYDESNLPSTSNSNEIFENIPNDQGVTNPSKDSNSTSINRSPISLLFKGVNPMGKPEDYENAFRNAKDAIQFKDIVSDAFHNFSIKYNSHLLLQDNDADDEIMQSVKQSYNTPN